MGRDERGRDRQRRQVDLGRRAVRREHVPELEAGSDPEVRRVRQAGQELRLGADDLPARDPRGPGRQRLDDRRAGQQAPAARGAAPDAPLPPAPAKIIGHQVFKFSPDGKLLMTLGKAGGGREAEYFYQPNDVLVAPNGDIFVSEGHSSRDGQCARPEVRQERQVPQVLGQVGQGARRVRSAARAGDGFEGAAVRRRSRQQPHPDLRPGRQLAGVDQFSRPSGIAIDKSDNIYVADSESGSVNPAHGAGSAASASAARRTAR